MASSFIAWYLFLAGAGAGAFLIGGLVDLRLRFSDSPWFDRISPVTDAGLVVGPVLVAFGSVFLFFDLGVPERVGRVFMAPLTSLLGIGSWSIVLFIACAVGALLIGHAYDTRISRNVERILHVAATILALFVMVYSGMFLSLFPSVPFLHTVWIPLIFVASALATGVAVLIVVGFFRREDEQIQRALNGLVGLDSVVIIIECVTVVGFLTSSSVAGDAIGLSAEALISGRLAGSFWLGVAFLGLVVPFAIDVICRLKPDPALLAVGASCTLVGGVILRYVLLLAAIRFSLTDMSVLSFWL